MGERKETESGFLIRFVGDLRQVIVFWALMVSFVRRMADLAALIPLPERRPHISGADLGEGERGQEQAHGSPRSLGLGHNRP